MPSLSKIASQTLLLSSLAAAAPSGKPSGAKVGTVRSLLAARGDGWEGASDGNVIIEVSNDMVNWGQGRADGGMLDWAMDECSNASCGADGKTSKTTTKYISDYNRYDLDIGLKVSGKFVTDDEGTWSHLKELADVTLKEFEDVADAPWTDFYGCYQTGVCEEMANKDRNPDNGPMKEGWYPREVHIVIQNDDGDARAWLDLTLSNNEGGATWDGLCSDLTSAGSTLSGLVSGIAGAAFSLAGLNCASS